MDNCTTCNPTTASHLPDAERVAECPDCWTATGTGEPGPAGYPSDTAGGAIGGYGTVPHGGSGPDSLAHGRQRGTSGDQLWSHLTLPLPKPKPHNR